MTPTIASTHFFQNLTPISNFHQIWKSDFLHQVPQDWILIISDVVGSTKAIEAGKYKDVNLAGAALIACLSNLAPEIEFPYIFGGDGANYLMPASYHDAVSAVCTDLKQMVKSQFGLDLRINIISLKYLYEKGFDLRVGKVQTNSIYTQTCFLGTALDEAERILKSTQVNLTDDFNLTKAAPSNLADYSGLTCRWQDVRSRHEKIASLIIKVVEDQPSSDLSFYEEVFGKIEEIFGTEHEYHPITEKQLKLSQNLKQLNLENKLKSDAGISRLLGLVNIWFINLWGQVMHFLKFDTANFSLSQKKRKMILASDFRKFDGTLKMVISGSNKQIAELENWLKEQTGKIKYGIQVSDKVLLTCFVFDKLGKEVHFVDGADGGYALAAKKLKTS